MIAYEITEQNNELIRDQIGAILTLEFENQAANYYNTDCEGVTFFVERLVPIGAEEQPFVNVSLDQGQYGNKHQGGSDGTYNFWIDVFASSKSIAENRGDKLAGIKAQRLAGICRAILEDPIYKHLSFGAGFIMKTMVTSIEMLVLNPSGQDTKSSRVCRMGFMVKATETITLPAGNLLTDHVTQIKLGISDKGLRYVYGTDSPSPVDTRYVRIIDQYGNVLALLEGGDDYTVTRLQRIIDTIIANEITVIDNIIP
jgi:hypothetical protein